MPLSEWLRMYRGKSRLTQGEMAEMLGVSRKTYASWEAGKVPKSGKNRKRIAELLGCETNEIDWTSNSTATTALAAGPMARMLGLAIGGSVAAAAGGGVAAAAGGLKDGISPLVAFAINGALGAYMLASSISAKGHDGQSGQANQAEALERDYTERRERVCVVAVKLVRDELDAIGMMHKVVSEPKVEENGPAPDAIIEMAGGDVTSWWLCFWPATPELDEAIGLTKRAKAHLMFARFLECEPDPARKMSMVIDDPGLYDELSSLRGHNSYRGNLSVILVDPQGMRLLGEAYIATYDDPLARETPSPYVGRLDED